MRLSSKKISAHRIYDTREKKYIPIIRSKSFNMEEKSCTLNSLQGNDIFASKLD